MKKLLSTLMALTLTLSSMAALTSNAYTFYIYDSDSDSYQNILEKYRPLDTETARNYFQSCDGFSCFADYDAFYTNEDASELIAAGNLSSIVVYNLADGASIGDVQAEISSYCDANETDFRYNTGKRRITSFCEENYEYQICRVGKSDPLAGQEYSVKITDAKNICKILKDKNLISGFKYVNRTHLEYFYASQNECPLNTYVISANESEKLPFFLDYVEENYPDCELQIEENKNGVQFIRIPSPNENASVEELMEYSIPFNNVCKVLDIGILGYVTPENVDIYSSPNSNIDLYNAVPGDANCDGKADIADATLILQSLTNRDEYSLTAQGSYNADVIGDLDGVTALDALEIQKLDAAVIDSLE